MLTENLLSENENEFTESNNIERVGERILPESEENVKTDKAILKELRAYVKDKRKLFGHGESNRSKAIVEVLTVIKRILDQ